MDIVVLINIILIQVEADPGKETLCPEIVDLIKNPLKIRFDAG